MKTALFERSIRTSRRVLALIVVTSAAAVFGTAAHGSGASAGYKPLQSLDPTVGSGINWPLALGPDRKLYATAVGDAGVHGWGDIVSFDRSKGMRKVHAFGIAEGGPTGTLLAHPNGFFYGTTYWGSTGAGSIYRMDADGVVTTIFSFPADSSLGRGPEHGLMLASDGLLYGTTYYGGKSDSGTIFRIDAKGQRFQLLHEFANGTQPNGRLVQAGDSLYGLTGRGGALGWGTAYALDRRGMFKTIYDFGSQWDGAIAPYGTLTVASDGHLYGVSGGGGSQARGTIFRLSRAGAYTTVVSLDATTGDSPNAPLLQASNGKLYGTTAGNSWDTFGSIFSLALSGEFSVLRTFQVSASGFRPSSGFVETEHGTFYGTTDAGGALGYGVLYRFVDR